MLVRRLILLVIAALPFSSRADAPPAREPFAKAHVTMMARCEGRDGDTRLAEVDVWAEGTRLRAKVRGEEGAVSGELWVDGLSAEAVRVLEGKVVEPRKRTLAQGLKLAFSPVTTLANSNNDRIAGHSCKLVTERVAAGLTLTRCIWRGLPLSVELSGRGFSFNAAATLVEEGAVAVADLQPPAGVPPAPASLNAAR